MVTRLPLGNGTGGRSEGRQGELLFTVYLFVPQLGAMWRNYLFKINDISHK